MSTKKDSWSGTVIRKSRGLLDGSNLYRRVRLRLDDGTRLTVRLDRDTWRRVSPGDRLVQEPGRRPEIRPGRRDSH